MSKQNDLLAKLAMVDHEIEQQSLLRKQIVAQLEAHVLAAGPVEAHGYRAHYKPARKTINHELAATENAAPEDLVLKHTKTKITTTTEWAKVTKDMGIPLAPYTTQPAPVFVVEQVTPF
jgi:hypothetical protein